VSDRGSFKWHFFIWAGLTIIFVWRCDGIRVDLSPLSMIPVIAWIIKDIIIAFSVIGLIDLIIGLFILTCAMIARIDQAEGSAEKCAVALGWWIPRKYRGLVVGDILEDCHELRQGGSGELRIYVHVLWQWAIAVGALLPVAIIGTIWRFVGEPK
jgi:hypothetical protein